MSIRIIEPDGVPYCTIHTDYQEYEILKYVCNYIIFEKDELVLEEDE